jgi:predicted MarR family transcription regulator
LKRTLTTARQTSARKTSRKTSGVNRPSAAERPGAWHLARTETERRLTDFEFGLERLAQAYYRWKAACLAAVCDVPLTGDDVAVLNVVRMGDEPKRLSEIGQLLNRVDVPNLQYATRKLVRVGLVETCGSSSRKETRYRATASDEVGNREHPSGFALQSLYAGGAGGDHQAASAIRVDSHRPAADPDG